MVAVNPLNEAKLPVYVLDSEEAAEKLFPEGSDAMFAIPECSEDIQKLLSDLSVDFDLNEKVVSPDGAKLQNSGQVRIN